MSCFQFSTLSLMMLCNLLQVSVPRHLPFKIGKIKEAACGGTGNAVLTGEIASTIVLLNAGPCSGWAVTYWSRHLACWKQGLLLV